MCSSDLGNYQTGSFLSSDELYSEETAISADLNGDSIIGAAFSTIESQGNATLLRRHDGQAFVQAGSERYAVASPFKIGTEDPSGTWQMLAAETIADHNQILWRNNADQVLHVWTLNRSWSWQSSSGNIDPSSAAGLELATNFQIDLNGSGLIG